MAKSRTKTVATNDSFSNPAARVGAGTPNLLEATQYVATRLTQNPQLLQNMYRSDWITRKVIDLPAEDMMKNWIQLTCKTTPQQIDSFNRAIEDTMTQHELLDAIKGARLFGGAGCVIKIDGHGGLMDQPLVLEEIEPGSFRGLIHFDRWTGITPGSQLIDDLNDPEFGKPAFYDVSTLAGTTTRVHSSRVLRFVGRQVMGWEKATTQHWGISEIELIYDELRKLDNTSWNIAGLIQRSNVFVTKYSGLRDLTSGLSVNEAGVRQFEAQQALTSQVLSSNGMLILDKDNDEFETHSVSFGGLNEVLTTFMLLVNAGCNIPFSRFFGQTVTGLSQSNEGDEQVYYDDIDSKRRREISPQLKKLFPIVCMSVWGEVPDDFSWKFNPIKTLSGKELGEIANAKVDAIGSAYDRGLPQRVFFQELSNLSEETGLFTSISPEMINAASDEVKPPQSELDLGGDDGSLSPDAEDGK